MKSYIWLGLILSFTLTYVNDLSAQSWTLQNPSEAPLELHDIYMDSTGFGWACGQKSAIYYTDNFGNSWSPRFISSSSSNFFHIDYLPSSNGQNLIVAGTQIASSQDGGLSWTVWIPDSSLGAYNGVEAINDSVAFVISNRGFLIKTEDAGLSWSNIPIPNPVQLWSIQFLDESVGWLGDINGRVLKTTDGGNTWITLNDTDMDKPARVAFIDEINGYAASFRDFYQTSDGGLSWTQIASNIFATNMKSLQIINDSTLYGAVTGRFYQSTDSGNSWAVQEPHPFSQSLNGFDVLPNGDIFIVGETNTILYSDDIAQSWTDQIPAIKPDLFFIDFMNADTGIAAGAGLSVLKTLDGGQNWELLDLNEADQFAREGIIVDEQEYWIMTLNKVLRTTDGGQNWTTLLESSAKRHRNLFQTPNGDVWLVHQDSGLYRTQDLGQNWEVVFDLDGRTFNASFLNDSLGILVGENGRIFRTKNGGASWDSIPSGRDQIFNKVFFATAEDVWIFPNSNIDTFLYSNDAGLTWSLRPAPRRAIYNDLRFVDDTTGYLISALSSSSFIYKTIDGGMTWESERFEQGRYNHLAVNVSDSIRVWVAGNGGRIEYKADTVAQDNSTPTNLSVISPTDIKIYPNPTNGELFVQVSPDLQAESLFLRIGNLEGRELKVQDLTTDFARVSLHDLPHGVYWLTISSNEQILTHQKIVITR